MIDNIPDRYLNPFTDFGFKALFGTEGNKDILIDFLNTLLEGEQSNIVELTFINNEQLGRSQEDRRAIFDLYCENEQGEKFIVELQKSKQNFFKDRSVYYSSFPIQEQGIKGKWNFELKAVYTIAILDFVFAEDKDDLEKFFYRVKLSDVETNKVFYDKLTFIYLEMPKFKKQLHELSNHFERWMYVIRNLDRLQKYPEQLQEKIFKKFFHEAELSNLNTEQKNAYEDSLKIYRDMNNVIDTAYTDGELTGHKKGLEQGLEQGALRSAKATAKKLKIMGLSTKQIIEATGLSTADINAL